MAIESVSGAPDLNGMALRADGGTKKEEPPKDIVREVQETIVFVVVLVLLLKLFVAEAFVIPTGSMAETLWGDHASATCPQCDYHFVVNNAERDGERAEIHWFTCPNCGYRCSAPDELRERLSSWSSGDRVLVSKFEFYLRPPNRFDVPVFKFPVEPYSPKDHSAMNYIKRLVGLGGETIAVYKGDLYVTRKLHYPNQPKPPDRDPDLWKYQYMYPSDKAAVELFERVGDPEGFLIIRKSPEQILAVRRIVFDLDHQPKRPTGHLRTRWHPSVNSGDGWQMEDKGFAHQGDAAGWMVYQHQEYGWETMPSSHPVVINDFLGYNGTAGGKTIGGNWVPDLIVECRADIQNADAEVVLDLNKGTDHFQARFANGDCQLVRYEGGSGKEKETVLGKLPSGIKRPGTYHLRFANVDSRLTVWVDHKALAFGDEASYSAPDRESFRDTENDRERPVRIGARGDVRCSRVQIWRDVYYTCTEPTEPRREQQSFLPGRDQMPECGSVQTLYVQPGHFLMFGDNSASSSDSRSWGLVPERLLLGRAVVVYWPPSRIGVIE